MLKEESRTVVEEAELDRLLDAIYRGYGFDFREYARASLKRRVRAIAEAEAGGDLHALRRRLATEPACMERFLLGLSVHTTAMFRDPELYLAFRRSLLPYLRTYPFIRIWDAGCSTGQEAYSLAILLQEEGVYGKSKLYATDLSDSVLRRAKEGIFPLASMRKYTSNYIHAGGRAAFSDYYTAKYGKAILSSALRKNLVFAQHNLVSDGSFNEFNIIFCRNVMIYFNRGLQERVHGLLYGSLAPFGYLVVGAKENLRFSPYEDRFEEVDAVNRIYRKVR